MRREASRVLGPGLAYGPSSVRDAACFRWGRNVYVSITKFLQFQLTINIVAVAITVLGAAVLNKAPLGAVQMLWVNLIMDSLASLALATEPPTDAMLKMQPFSAQAPLLTNKVLKHIAGQAAYQVGRLWPWGPHRGRERNADKDKRGKRTLEGEGER